MTKLVNIPPTPHARERVVVIGGGFAGLEIARKINKKKYQVILVDKNNYHQFQPLFYQVATCGLEPSSICYPLRKHFQKEKNVHFRMCVALEVLPDQNMLQTNIGQIYYDHLVVATGCDTNYFGNEALRDNTFALKSIAESILVRNRILLSLERATNVIDIAELRRMLCFTIVGGGATGVELAGALADMKKTILPKDYPDLDFNQMEIHLIDGAPRLLSAMSEKSSQVVKQTLQERGVIVHLNVMVTKCVNPVVDLSDSTQILSDNVFWVGGVQANSIKGLAQSAYNRGRLVVNQFNQVVGYSNIYSIGDTSLLADNSYPHGHPQVAQVALQMAIRLAENFNLKAKSLPARSFSYVDSGSLATIGRNAAVADIGKLHFSGFVAWWVWLFVHIVSMIGMRNKIVVMMDWVWSYFNYGLSLRLLIRPERSKIYDPVDPKKE